jgi:hypothetical protein
LFVPGAGVDAGAHPVVVLGGPLPALVGLLGLGRPRRGYAYAADLAVLLFAGVVAAVAGVPAGTGAG